MIKKIFFNAVSILLLLVFAGNLLADEDYSFFRNIGEDFKYLVSFPTRLNNEGALVTLGFIGAGGAILASTDGKLKNYVQDHRTSKLDDISPSVGKIGHPFADLGFLAVYGGSGYLMKNEKMQETALLSFESFVVSNLIGGALKVGAGRARPIVGKGSAKFSPLSTDENHTSFPSEHTLNAFSIASVFADEYDNPLVAVSAYSVASLVAMQRIYENKHWATDVFVGALIGTFVGKSVVHLHKKKNKESALFVPTVNPGEGSYGMDVVWRY
ncbi:MAG: phosphatase PAP2 family protein [Planctomycetota bacterium]|nr:phosphatase PAP2 family protein [Planctomycetota bacterium]MDE1890624.1 phosphatase PAP2 family protein [Planctomycetota bacterium]MDE2217693.1 phosphatase PAP2 family protein [Planctomycetota bacterium]